MTPYERAIARLTRRDWLRLAATVGAAAIAVPIVARRVLAKPAFTGYPFSLGVASGDPTPTGVVLWTRLAPDPLAGGGMPTAVVDVNWELASDDRFRSIVQSGTAKARPELGHSVHVEVEGLRPGREYWYRFHAGGDVSRTGRTVTAPAAGAPVDRLRFAVCGCNDWESGYFTAFRHLAEEHFDFVFHTGDYIYETAAEPGYVRQHNGGELYTLVDYRNRYALYKSDRDLQLAHESAPFIVSWDDHEVSDNYAGDFDEDGTPPELFLLRRAAAYQAYYEMMPLRASALPVGSHMKLYRRFQFGTLIDLSVLDTRQWRTDQPCGDGARTGCSAALDPRQTMMGAEQEKWLFDNLATASAAWTVIGQQVYTFAYDRSRVAPLGRFVMDKWDGYVAARQRLYERLHQTKAPNPIVLSGDVHVHFGADLKMDFTDSRSPTVGVEFTNSAITSSGDGSDILAEWDVCRPDNPHIRYHSNRRGYIACTATPQHMRADFKILDKVSVPGRAVAIGGSLIVEKGHPGCELT
jgi:alkaline phosphatase D